MQNKIQSSIIVFADIESAMMGHRQTVRHWTLTPASQGSNPCGPVYRIRYFRTENVEIHDLFFLYLQSKKQGTQFTKSDKLIQLIAIE